METLKIDLNALRARRIYVATPAYGGMVHVSFHQSMMKLQKLMQDIGIKCVVSSIYNESLIPRARNTLAHEFLKTDCTDLFFVDSDIEFDALDVLALLHYNKPVIGGIYPLKGINWQGVKEALAQHPELPVDELPRTGAKWASALFKGVYKMEEMTPIEVPNLATGFMLISRGALEAVAPTRPKYSTFHPITGAVAEGIVDFFPAGPVKVADRDTLDYESEDYGFCRVAREAGQTLWLCPWFKLIHHGSYAFEGGLLGTKRVSEQFS